MAEHGMFGLGVIDSCPECGSNDLCAVHDGRGTNIFCNSCAACWSTSLGWVRRVNPSSCPGCSRRAECLARQVAQTRSVAQPSPESTPAATGGKEA